MAWFNGSTAPELQRLLVPFVCALIAFLAYAPQWLFAHSPDLAPGPLTPAESRLFNALVACLWWTYYKAVTTDPGRYVFPPDLLKRYQEEKKKKRRIRRRRRNSGLKNNNDKTKDNGEGGDEDEEDEEEEEEEEEEEDDLAAALRKRRWCKKCSAPKPPRAHHCRTCRRCVPRMDHHCPWTANCVSLQTFPHFVRFLAWANASLAALLYHSWRRLAALWGARHLPAYLGPPAPHLALLAAVALVAAVTAALLAVLLATTVRGWLFNVTMIEAWEIERHEAALERLPGYRGDGRDGGGYGEGDGGGGSGSGWWRSGESAPGGDLAAPHLAVDPVEFPYDVGVFANMAQAMGTRNVFLWFWPFAGGPTVEAPPSASASASKYPSSSSAASSAYGDEVLGMLPLPSAGTGWRYEENGLNDREGMWPPVDPEKARHARLWRQRRREMLATEADADARYYGGGGGGGGDRYVRTPQEEREAFRRRQERDLRRWRGTRERIMGELEEVVGDDDYDYDYDYDGGGTSGGGGGGGGVILDQVESSVSGSGPGSGSGSRSGSGSSWVNADGEKLGDYGVDDDDDEDEDEEDDDLPVVVDKRFIPPLDSGSGNPVEEDDEEVPLAELIRRRKVLTKDGEDT